MKMLVKAVCQLFHYVVWVAGIFVVLTSEEQLKKRCCIPLDPMADLLNNLLNRSWKIRKDQGNEEELEKRKRKNYVS